MKENREVERRAHMKGGGLGEAGTAVVRPASVCATETRASRACVPDQAGIGEAKLADVQATPARDEDSSVVVSPPNEASIFGRRAPQSCMPSWERRAPPSCTVKEGS